MCSRVYVCAHTCMDVNEHVVHVVPAWKVWNLEVQMCMGVYLVVGEDSLSPAHFNIIGGRQHS